MVRGHLVLLMAPSGSGKGHIVAALGALREELYFAKTYTTRAPRKGADENPLYTFVSRAEFEHMIEDKAFIEWANFGGNLYGTPKEEILGPLHEGRVVFKEMELQGILQMEEILGKEHMTVIYVEAGGWDVLRRRIVGRASISDEELELRRLRYEEESKAKAVANVIIENFDGKLEEARHAFNRTIAQIINNVDNVQS